MFSFTGDLRGRNTQQQTFSNTNDYSLSHYNWAQQPQYPAPQVFHAYPPQTQILPQTMEQRPLHYQNADPEMTPGFNSFLRDIFRESSAADLSQQRLATSYSDNSYYYRDNIENFPFYPALPPQSQIWEQRSAFPTHAHTNLTNMPTYDFPSYGFIQESDQFLDHVPDTKQPATQLQTATSSQNIFALTQTPEEIAQRLDENLQTIMVLRYQLEYLRSIPENICKPLADYYVKELREQKLRYPYDNNLFRQNITFKKLIILFREHESLITLSIMTGFDAKTYQRTLIEFGLSFDELRTLSDETINKLQDIAQGAQVRDLLNQSVIEYIEEYQIYFHTEANILATISTIAHSNSIEEAATRLAVNKKTLKVIINSHLINSINKHFSEEKISSKHNLDTFNNLTELCKYICSSPSYAQLMKKHSKKSLRTLKNRDLNYHANDTLTSTTTATYKSQPSTYVQGFSSNTAHNAKRSIEYDYSDNPHLKKAATTSAALNEIINEQNAKANNQSYFKYWSPRAVVNQLDQTLKQSKTLAEQLNILFMLEEADLKKVVPELQKPTKNILSKVISFKELILLARYFQNTEGVVRHLGTHSETVTNTLAHLGLYFADLLEQNRVLNKLEEILNFYGRESEEDFIFTTLNIIQEKLPKEENFNTVQLIKLTSKANSLTDVAVTLKMSLENIRKILTTELSTQYREYYDNEITKTRKFKTLKAICKKILEDHPNISIETTQEVQNLDTSKQSNFTSNLAHTKTESSINSIIQTPQDDHPQSISKLSFITPAEISIDNLSSVADDNSLDDLLETLQSLANSNFSFFSQPDADASAKLPESTTDDLDPSFLSEFDDFHGDYEL